jgi:hypothetical protein
VLEDMPRGRRRGWALGRAGGDAGWFRMAAAVPLKLRQSK